MLPFLIFGAFVAVFVAVAAFGYRAELRRTAKLAEAAAELGFEFLPKGDTIYKDHCSGFHLFSQGHSKKVLNLLRGKTENLDVAIFDYEYTVGSGKNRSTFQVTVACFRADLGLPAFSLRPEGFWNKVGALLGYTDINFDTHPNFSKTYLLKGHDKEAIRETFDEEVLEFFEQRPGLSVEAAGDVLAFYKQGQRVDPDALKEFLAEGLETLRVFVPSGPNRPGA